MVFWFFKKRDDSGITKVHSAMEKSFSNIKKDIGSLSLWINHFKSKHESHDNSFDKVIKEIEQIKKMFNEHLEEHHSQRLNERSSVHERVQSFERHVQSFMNVQNLKEKLTPSQKKVLNLLNKANMPLDYETIANELKLNVVTVRRHVNDIKKVFEVKEMRDIDRGRKVFYLEKEAKMTLKSRK